MQITTDDGLRLFPFSHLDRSHTLLSSDPSIEACEIDELGPKAERLRNDRVVVTFLREVTVTAGLGFSLALGMWVVRVHRLRAVTRSCDRWLLNVDTLSVGVGRRQHKRRRGAHRRHLAALARPAPTQHEDVLTQNLRVVGRVIARLTTFVTMPIGLGISLDRQVAATATRGPRRVAGVALHLVVTVGKHLPRNIRTKLLTLGVFRHRLGASRLRVVMGITRRDGIFDLRHLPLESRRHSRSLNERIATPLKAKFSIRVANQTKLGSSLRRSRPRGAQVGNGGSGAVAVLAIDFDGSRDRAMQVTVAV